MIDETAAGDGCGGQAAAPSLRVPDWVPSCIRPQALKIFERDVRDGHSCDAALVRRLLTDERMKPVWQELLKHRRDGHAPTANFHHRALPPDGYMSVTASDTQGRALQELFFKSLTFAREPYLTGRGEHHAAMAASLRKDATFADEQQSRKYQAIGRAFRKAATAYDRMDDLLSADHARRVAVQIADVMQDRFGTPGYGMTATITSVALDDSITLSQVRHWHNPARKRKRSMGKKGRKARSSS
jgi:hypothetical protein